MLSEALIKEFTNRNCPSTKLLVTKAWDSLTLESKLEIIHAYKSQQVELYIPNWLMNLALDDKEEIIRILAAYGGEPTIEINEIFEDFGLFNEVERNLAKKIQAKIKNDKSNIVKNRIDETTLFIDFKSIPQDIRLLNIRAIKNFRLNIFIASLDQITSELSKEDLIDCLDEIIGNMGNFGFDIPDIDSLNKAWGLLSKLDDNVASKLARIIPIKVFMGLEVDSATFLNLKPNPLFCALVANKENPSRELQKTAKIITDAKISDYDKYTRELAWQILPKDVF